MKIYNKNFSFLLIGQFISVMGDRISTAVFISIAVAIVQSFESSYQSSLLVAVQLIPIMLFGYFFGLLADRHKKKKIMIFADIARAAIIFSLFLFHESLIYLYISVFLIGTFTSMFEASKRSILPFIIPKEKLISLNKFYATMEIIAMMVGFGVGAFLLEIISIEKALLLDMSTYLFSFFLLTFIKYHDIEEKIIKKEKHKLFQRFNNYLKELKIGFSYLNQNHNLKAVIVNIVFFHFLAAGLYFSIVIDFAIRNSQMIGIQAGSHSSMILLIVAIGAMLSPLILKFSKNIKDSTITQASFLIGSILFFISLYVSTNFPNHYFLLLGTAFFLGIIGGIQYIRYLYLIHLNCEKKIMGRIVSVSEITISLTVVIGIMFGAYINELFTYSYAFLAPAIIYLIGFLFLTKIKHKISW